MTPHGRWQFDHPVFRARIKLLVAHDKQPWFAILYLTIAKSDWSRSWDSPANFSSMARVTRNMVSRFLMGVFFRCPWNTEKTVLLSYASYLSTDARVTQDSLFQIFCASSLCSRNVDINPVTLWQVSFMTFPSDCLTLICIVFIWIRSNLELCESPELCSFRTHWLHDVLASSFCHVSAVQVIIVYRTSHTTLSVDKPLQRCLGFWAWSRLSRSCRSVLDKRSFIISRVPKWSSHSATQTVTNLLCDGTKICTGLLIVTFIPSQYTIDDPVFSSMCFRSHHGLRRLHVKSRAYVFDLVALHRDECWAEEHSKNW